MDGIESLAEFFDTEEFAVAFAWGLVFLGVGGPLLAECHRHLVGGHVLFGCAFGATGLFLGALCTRRITVALWGGRQSFEFASSADAD